MFDSIAGLGLRFREKGGLNGEWRKEETEDRRLKRRTKGDRCQVPFRCRAQGKRLKGAVTRLKGLGKKAVLPLPPGHHHEGAGVQPLILPGPFEPPGALRVFVLFKVDHRLDAGRQGQQGAHLVR